jgi:signal peptidase I
MKRTRKLASRLGNVALGVALAALAIFAVNAAIHGLGTLPGGYRPLVVLSGSMEPVMPTGSLILTKSIDPSAIRVGDVITFRLHNMNFASDLATHRVVAVATGSAGREFVTQGDANSGPDMAPVPAADLVGRVAMVSVTGGAIARFVRTPLFVMLLVAVAAGLAVLTLHDKVVRRRAGSIRSRDGAADTPGLAVVPGPGALPDTSAGAPGL